MGNHCSHGDYTQVGKRKIYTQSLRSLHESQLRNKQEKYPVWCVLIKWSWKTSLKKGLYAEIWMPGGSQTCIVQGRPTKTRAEPWLKWQKQTLFRTITVKEKRPQSRGSLPSKHSMEFIAKEQGGGCWVENHKRRHQGFLAEDRLGW